MRRIWVLTLFPEFFSPLISAGVVRRAFEGEAPPFSFHLVNIRDFAVGKYKSVDDYPFGGGPGMVMRPDVLKKALFEGVITPGGYDENNWRESLKVIFPSPRGQKWDYLVCKRMVAETSERARDLVFICGRYEGVDERFLKKYVEEEFSIGDFVLSGGEIPTMAFLDSFLRQVPGILGNAQGTVEESFEGNLLEAPQYTKPRDFEGEEVPLVYLSGHHKLMNDFKAQESYGLTKKLRPDLLSKKSEDCKKGRRDE